MTKLEDKIIVVTNQMPETRNGLLDDKVDALFIFGQTLPSIRPASADSDLPEVIEGDTYYLAICIDAATASLVPVKNGKVRELHNYNARHSEVIMEILSKSVLRTLEGKDIEQGSIYFIEEPSVFDKLKKVADEIAVEDYRNSFTTGQFEGSSLALKMHSFKRGENLDAVVWIEDYFAIEQAFSYKHNSPILKYSYSLTGTYFAGFVEKSGKLELAKLAKVDENGELKPVDKEFLPALSEAVSDAVQTSCDGNLPLNNRGETAGLKIIRDRNAIETLDRMLAA